MQKKELFPDILRGFFAGEGSVLVGSHNRRSLRIAQKIQKNWIDEILNHLNISYVYYPKSRTYEITGKWNWDVFAKHKLADLHLDKKRKFHDSYSSYKEIHYPNNFIKNKLLADLQTPKTTEQLSEKYVRSKARIIDILIELKKNRLVSNFPVRSKHYWVCSDADVIVISDVKKNYLDALRDSPKNTTELAKFSYRSFRSAKKRLTELERLGLIERNKFNKWQIVTTSKKIIVT